jgi:inositol polyphosphate 5-phosphatase INPP5B/F
VQGNKGAVAMRFRFRNTHITCVASHLAANDGMMEKRNSDYHEIIRRLQFPLNPATPAEAAEQLRPVSASIFESDILIWMVCFSFGSYPSSYRAAGRYVQAFFSSLN